MELIGLPDFHAPLIDESPTGWGRACWPFGGGTRCFAFPNRLDLQTRSDGTPDFLLELIRPFVPNMPPAPRGVMELSVAAACTGIEQALRAFRHVNPGATVEPLAPTGGSFRFCSASATIPAALLEPIPLMSSGLGSLRLVRELPFDAALLLRETLVDGTSAISAMAELDFNGVAPRLPLRVRFDTVGLLTALGAVRGGQAVVAGDVIVSQFQMASGAAGVTILGDATLLANDSVAAEFANVMTDLVLLHYGSVARSHGAVVRPSIALPALEGLPAAMVEWDLSQPAVVSRTVDLRLDAFEVLGPLVQRQGIASVVRETTIPPVPIGTVNVDVAANLPSARVGLRMVGCDIIAPPRPPGRPDAVIKTVTFVPPSDKVRFTMQLSPGEVPALSACPFVWRDTQTGPQRLVGPARPFPGGMLTLSAQDFPVTFVSVEAGDDVLALATIRVICTWDGCDHPIEAELIRDTRTVAFALPAGATNGSIEIRAVPLVGAGEPVVLPPAPARSMRLSLASFPGFGAHAVILTAPLLPAASILVIDLKPEGMADEPANITTVAFTAAHRSRDWTWFAASPFAAGYRWRYHVDAGTQLPWSEVQSPFATLNIPEREAAEVAT